MFCLTVPKNAVGEPFSLSLISGIEKVWMRGWGGVSRFSFDFFLSHTTETFRRGTLLCCVSEIFRWPKSFWIRGGGSIKIIRRNFFCLTVPKIFVGEPLSFSEISGVEKC